MSELKLLQFNYVKVANFFSYKEATLTLNDKGLTSVSGYNKANKKSNGSGKSVLIAEAIVYALYGETIRKIAVGKIPNRFTKGQCSVELNFTLNNHTYTIIRSRRPDSLKLFIDGADDDLAQGDSRDTNKKIIDIIGMGFEEFINSILFGQNIQKYFFLLTDAKQKDMLDNIIAIGIFDSWKEQAKIYKDKFEKLLVEKTAKVNSLLSSITTSQNRISEYNIKESQFLLSKNMDYDTEINDVLQQMRVMSTLVDSITTQYKVIDQVAYKDLCDKEFKMVDGIGKLTTLSSSLKQTLNKKNTLPLDSEGNLVLYSPSESRPAAELYSEIKNLDLAINTVNSEIMAKTVLLKSHTSKVKSVESIAHSDCPTCGRMVDDTCINSIREAYVSLVDAIKSESEVLNQKLTELSNTKIIINNAIVDRNNTVVLKEVTDARADIIKYEGMKDVISGQLSDIRLKISVIKSDIEHNNQLDITIAQHKSTIKGLEDRLAKANAAKASLTVVENPYISLRYQEEQAIISYNKDVETVYAEINGINQWIEGCKYWYKAWGDKDGVKSVIYEKVFPYLNDRCNHYLNVLSNGEIRAEIGLDDKDRFVVKTENSMGADVYGGNSGGERRRIDLAIMFGLHDLVASRKYKSNILILDEIFDNLDTNGIDTAMALLEDISSGYDSIFVISHTDMQEYFDNHLYIIKDGNTSVVSTTLEVS